MKMLVIYMDEKKELLDQISLLFERMKISFNTFLIKPPASSAGPESFGFHPADKYTKLFRSFFDQTETENSEDGSPTHLLVVSSLPKRWFDFLAGFSFGSRLPVLIGGSDAIAGISEEFASCFIFLKDGDSLKSFLKAENTAYKKQKAAREIIKAQNTLLRLGVPITAESLALCVAEGRVKEISLFFAAGFSPDIRNKAGVPLLNIAARNGNRETVSFLISSNANLNLQADDRGTSALIDGVMGKHKEIVFDLIKAGANLNTKTKDGQTALIVAVGTGDEQIVEALLKAGADPDTPDSLGATARKYATLFQKKNIMGFINTYAPLGKI